MFERMTERARQVIVLAQDEARLLRHNYIGTEHLLLGLLREEEGIAARVLRDLGVDHEHLRGYIRRAVGVGDEALPGQIPFTPRSKKVLDLALREALSLGHNYVGTEHILLGLVRENEGVGARYLHENGHLTPDVIRQAIVAKLHTPTRSPGQEPAQQTDVSPVNPQLARFMFILLNSFSPNILEGMIERSLEPQAGGVKTPLIVYAESLAGRFNGT